MNHRTRLTRSRLRIGAGLLSFILGLVYAVQITPAFNAWRPIGMLLIITASAQIVYAGIISLKVWSTDQLGHRRTLPEARRRARHWCWAGIIGNLTLVVFLATYLLSTIEPFGTPELALLALGIEVLDVAILMILVRSSTSP